MLFVRANYEIHFDDCSFFCAILKSIWTSDIKQNLNHTFHRGMYNARLSSIYEEFDLLQTCRGCLSIGRDCWRTESIPRGNTHVVILKFEIGSFVRVDGPC